RMDQARRPRPPVTAGCRAKPVWRPWPGAAPGSAALMLQSLHAAVWWCFLFGLDKILEVEPVADVIKITTLGVLESRFLGVLRGYPEGERPLTIAPGRLHFAGRD